MPYPPRRPEPLAGSVFTTRQALECGLTKSQLRSHSWRRLFRGAHADSRLTVDHGLRCRAMALLMPPGAAIAGASAAWLYGVEFARLFDPVEVRSPRRFGPVRGSRIRIGPLPETHVGNVLHDVPVTTPARTAWDLAVHRQLVPAVKILDGMLRRGVVKPADLDDLVSERRPGRGWRKAHRVFRLADGRAESFPESELRVRLTLAGLPPPVPQYEVRVGGRFLARVDLGWPEYRVAVEYDGAHHADVEQMRWDRRRLNDLVTAGWVVLHVTADRLRHDFPRLLTETRTALTP